jgi:hemoglobin-like flavoprotein
MRGINVALVQQTWEQVLPIADDAAQLFYNRLFELDPSLRTMFTQTDMAEQRKKLMQMITVAVRGLGKLDELIPAVRALGKRHVGYGVQPHHYDTVGAALLWTLEQGLGAAFTEEARESWTVTYFTLANTMRIASQSVAA